MSGPAPDRKTMTVVFTDIVKSSAIAHEREEWFIERRNADMGHFADLVEKWRGRVVKDLGDGLLCVFDSAVDAMRCAVEMQAWADEGRRKRDAQGRHVSGANPDALLHRFGVHTGEVYPRGDDISGDAVNLAKRYEENSWWNGIHYSEVVRHTVAASMPLRPKTFYPFYFKSINEPFRTYMIPSALGALQMPPPDWHGPKPTPVHEVPAPRPSLRERAADYRRFFQLSGAICCVAVGALVFQGPIKTAVAHLRPANRVQEPDPVILTKPTPNLLPGPVVTEGPRGSIKTHTRPNRPSQKVDDRPAAPVGEWWGDAAPSYDYATMESHLDSADYRPDAEWRRAKADAAALGKLKKWALESMQSVTPESPLTVRYMRAGMERRLQVYTDIGQEAGQITVREGTAKVESVEHPDGGQVTTGEEAGGETIKELFVSGPDGLFREDHLAIFKALRAVSPGVSPRSFDVFLRIHRKYGPD